jgi:hypothetical protein
MGTNGRLKLDGISHVLLSLLPFAVLNSITPTELAVLWTAVAFHIPTKCGVICHL